MCRFLLVKSKKEINCKPLLSEFAERCRQSKEWQGDGWGICWQDEKGNWHEKRSLSPIWKSRLPFKQMLGCKMFVIHARSASFKEQRGRLWHNQPYVANGLIFVFNGFLHGVKLHLPGETGAEKIFNFLQKKLKKSSFSQGLKSLRKLIRRNTKKVLGCNVGVTDGKVLACLCDFDEDEEYYTLCYHKNKDLNLICSMPLRGYQWQKMKKGEVNVLGR